MKRITNRLIVYGTLAPGRSNEHVLGNITGTWEPATVTGWLRQEGWGAALGYPGILLDEQGDEVQGWVFTSESLAEHWARLDAFEGEGYERVVVPVELEAGGRIRANLYARG